MHLFTTARSTFKSLLRGTLKDTAGSRNEKTYGYVVNFNFRKTMLMVTKIIKLFDSINNTNNYAKFEFWDNKLNFQGFEFKPNIYISKSHSTIYGENREPVRAGQTRDDWSIGIGVIGGFPNFLSKNKSTLNTENGNKSEKEIIIIEEDGELIEK